MRPLHGLRPHPDRVEADEFPVELGGVLRPDLLHREHLLGEPLEARLGVGAVVLHLLDVPAAADPEEEAPVGDEVDARHLFGGRDRVGTDIALLDPRQSSAGEGWYLWPDQWLEANVTGLGQEHGTHTDGQIVGTRAMLIHMGEVRGEARPGLDLQQQFG